MCIIYKAIKIKLTNCLNSENTSTLQHNYNYRVFFKGYYHAYLHIGWAVVGFWGVVEACGSMNGGVSKCCRVGAAFTDGLEVVLEVQLGITELFDLCVVGT